MNKQMQLGHLGEGILSYIALSMKDKVLALAKLIEGRPSTC